MYRVGIGYDVHKFAENRDLILGGVKIDYQQGLLGHSDADVLLHAIMDALLGAASLKDIGYHFSDKDEKFKGISSIKLLKHVNKLLKEKNYSIVNIDSVIICEKPKLRPYINIMNKTIAEALEIEEDRVNVKATTTEKLGFTGRGEGIAAEAIASLLKNS